MRLFLGLAAALAILAGSALIHRLPVGTLSWLVGDGMSLLDFWRVALVGAAAGAVLVRLLDGRAGEARGWLFGLTALLAVVFGFISFRQAPVAAVALVGRLGYWQILAVALVFGCCLWSSLRDDVRRAWHDRRVWRWPAAVILGAAVFLHLQENHGFKIVMDEVVLQGTAMRMHYDREATVTIRGYDFVGTFTALGTYVDKRPLFFPFLVSVLHDLTGYRTANSLILNALLTPVFTALLFLTGRRLAGMAGGAAAVLLAVTIPLVHQNATGAGFELLNMVMILAAVWLGMRYAEKPGPERLGAFVFAGVLLAQTRYESALFALPVGLVVLYVWWRNRAADFSWPVIAAPLAFVIIPLHFNVFKVATSAWQLADITGAVDPFALRYFYENVGHALNFLFATDGIHSNSFLVSALGLLGVAFSLFVLLRQGRAILADRPAEAVFGCFVLSLVAHTALMLFYFWGKFDDPLIRRLSLPLHLLLILSFIHIYPMLVKARRQWAVLAAVTGLFIVGVTLPNVAKHRYNQENYAARWNNWIADFLETLGPGEALAIDRHSGIQWFQHGKSSMPVDALAREPERYEFHFRNRSFQHYFVVQVLGPDFDKGTRFPTVDDDVGEGLTLETVAEVMMAPTYYMRLSRVVAVDLEKIKEWRQRRQSAAQLTPETKKELDKTSANLVDLWFRMLP
jgi:hypothetical protein